MDEIDRAQGYEDIERANSIRNALIYGAMNPRLGAMVCIKCKTENDKTSRANGFDVCIDCRETPGWHLIEDGV